MKLAGVHNSEKRLRMAISDGSALAKFRQMVSTQGGALESLDDPNTHKPKFRKKLYAEKYGYISFMDTLSLGTAVVHLGGGRLQRSDILDPTVGIIFYKKIGDEVNVREPLLEIFCSDIEKLKMGYEKVKGAIIIGENKAIDHPLIIS